MNESRKRLLLTDADRFPLKEDHLALLKEEGIELVELPFGATETELALACAEADGLLVFGTKITAPVIAAMNRCRIIARCGIGYDNIDVAAAADKGITLTYVPDYCVEEVSDHAISLMLDAMRKLSFSRERVNQGLWDSYESLGTIRRLAGRTVGLFGFGRIARAVARKLQTFRVRLIAYDPYAPAEAIRSSGVDQVSFDELIGSADVLCLMAPLTAETKHVIDRPALERMKRGVVLINTSRGPLVNENALLWALEEGIVGAAGLDVLEREPPGVDHPLLRMPQVTITPHSAAFSDEALHEVVMRSVSEVIRNFRGMPPLMPVPLPAAGNA